MIDKIVISALILAETLIFCYVPKIAFKFAKYRNDWFNVQTLNNAASGALMALAITHLLPECFDKTHKSFTILDSVDMRGFIVAAPILLLVTTDFLASSDSFEKQKDSSLTMSTDDFCIEDPETGSSDRSEKKQITISSSNPDTNDQGKKSVLKLILSKVKEILGSRYLYFLIFFYGHCVFEGSLVGSYDGSSMWAMALGILAHNWAECLILVSILNSIIKSEVLKNVCIIIFSLCIPLGILIGYLVVTKSDDISCTVFSLLAVGFFIYLSFELFTPNDGQTSLSKMSLWIFFLLGMSLMSIILAFSNYLESRASSS